MAETPRAAPKKDAKVKGCPICGKPRAPKFEPFCSARCADVDLHRWLKGTYVIPGAERPSVEGEGDEEE
jgi:endogenous inhibitor of DNA gyrase (YacG/DUF329 family)